MMKLYTLLSISLASTWIIGASSTFGEDVTPPWLECPPDISIQCGQEPLPSIAGAAKASDDHGFVCISFLDEILDGSPGENYVILRTWRAVDSSGNHSTCSQQINIISQSSLVLSGVPEDVTVTCGQVPEPADVTVVGGVSGGGEPSDEGLALHYTFDSDGGVTVLDHGPNGYHGTVVGAVHEENGRFGGAMRFDGSSYIDVGNLLDVGTVNPVLTASVWFKASPEMGGASATVLGKQRDGFSQYTGWSLRHDPRPIADLIANFPQRADALGSGNLYDDVWHHMVGVFEVDEGLLRSTLYLNGEEVVSRERLGPHSGTETLATLRLGARSPTGSEFFTGLIDEVRIYTRRLTAEEIMQLHQQGAEAGPDVVFEEVVEGDCPGVITRTWSVTDECGNVVSTSQVITVIVECEDNLALSGVPEDVTVTCGNVPEPAVVSVVGGASGSVEPTSEGLVLHNTFDSDDGPVVVDQSGSGYNGFVSGAVYEVDGRFGGAMSFDGASYIDAGDVLDIGESNPVLTASVWFKASPEMDGTPATVLGKQWDSSFPYKGWSLRHDPRPLADLAATWPERAAPFVDTNLYDNSWHHMVGVFEVSNDFLRATLYLNGEEVEDVTYHGVHSGTETIASLRLGARSPTGSEFFSGLIDEVRIYDRRLSAEEIGELCEQGAEAGPEVVFEEVIEGDCPGVITRTWSVTNDCGDVVSASQVIIVESSSSEEMASLASTPGVLSYDSEIGKYYTLQLCRDLVANVWEDVPDMIRVPGTGNQEVMVDDRNVGFGVYRILVE